MRFDQSILAVVLVATASHLSLSDASAAGGNNPAIYGGGYQSYGEQSSLQAAEPSSSTPEQQLPPLPLGWSEHIDPSSGQPYYFNAADGTTTWDRPTPPASDYGSEEKESTPLEEKVEEAGTPVDVEVEAPSGLGMEAEASDAGTSPAAEVRSDQSANETDSGAPVKAEEENVLTGYKRSEDSLREEEAWRQSQGWGSDRKEAVPEAEQQRQQQQPQPQPQWGMPRDAGSQQQQQPWEIQRDSGPQQQQRFQRPRDQAPWGVQEQSSSFSRGSPQVDAKGQRSQQKSYEQPQQQYQGRPQGMPGHPTSLEQPMPGRPTRQETTAQAPERESTQQAEKEPEIMAPWGSSPPPSQGQLGQQEGMPPRQQRFPPQQQEIVQDDRNTTQYRTGGTPFQRQPVQGQQGRPDEQQQQGSPSQRMPPTMPQGVPEQHPPPRSSGQYDQQPQQQQPPQTQQAYDRYGQFSPQTQGQYGNYGQYGQYGHYGQYGQYGQDGQQSRQYGSYQQQGHQQLGRQLETQDTGPPSAIKDALGSAWHGLLGFSNRTKTAVENARNTVVETARDASHSLSTTSASKLFRYTTD